MYKKLTAKYFFFLFQDNYKRNVKKGLLKRSLTQNIPRFTETIGFNSFLLVSSANSAINDIIANANNGGNSATNAANNAMSTNNMLNQMMNSKCVFLLLHLFYGRDLKTVKINYDFL